MTWDRLGSLVDMHHRAQQREMYDLGVALSYAYHKPENLKQLLPKKEIDWDSLPAMLRPSEKKVNPDG